MEIGRLKFDNLVREAAVAAKKLNAAVDEVSKTMRELTQALNMLIRTEEFVRLLQS
jgi:hypothetical protein